MAAFLILVAQIMFWVFISWKDIRTQKIPLWPCILFGGLGLAASIGSGMSCWEILGGAAAGAGILVLAYASGQSLGYGDALCIGVIGIWNGISSMIWILMCSMFLLLLTALPLLLLKKVTGKTKLPMAPFLTAGLALVEVSGIWITF